MEISAENVEKALDLFYSEPQLQSDLNQWLTAAQISPDAWTICWELLRHNKGIAVQLFGANCLHLKLTRFWSDVPEDQQQGLRERLLDHIVTFASGPKLILSKLCVCLSSLALQTMPEQWPNAIQHVITMFQDSVTSTIGISERCTILLQILHVLPEEFSSCYFHQYRRGVLRHTLNQNWVHVMAVIQSILTPDTPLDLVDLSFQCLSSWIQFGASISEAEPLFVQVFHGLSNEELFERSLDVLINVFYHPEAHQYKNLLQRLFTHVLQLNEPLKAAIQRADTDYCQGVCRLVSAIADKHTTLLLNNVLSDGQGKQTSLGIVQMMLDFTGMPGVFAIDETCSDLTLSFWYNLQEDIFSASKEHYITYIQIFHPVYMNLLNTLLVKVQYPPDDIIIAMNKEENEQFRCYRQDINDTAIYVYKILRDLLLIDITTRLSELGQRSQKECVRWQEPEALLFILGGISENVPIEESTYLPTIFDLLQGLKLEHSKMVSTLLQTIGCYSEWMSFHPQILASVLPPVLRGMHNVEVATSATMALRDIARDNREHMTSYVPDILTSCQRAISGGALKCRECVRLMSCIGYVLSPLATSQCMEYLSVILSPHIEHLASLSNQQPSASNKAAILMRLEMLSWLFQSLDNFSRDEGDDEGESEPKSDDVIEEEEPKPVLLILQNVLPVLQNLGSMWKSDPGIIAAICDVVKKAVSNLLDDIQPLINNMCILIMQLYNEMPNSAILDLTKQLIVLFGKSDLYQSTIATLFHTLCATSQQFLGLGAHEHTDIMESFMTLLSQIMKKNSSLFMIGQLDVSGLFHTGIVGIGLPEILTVKSSCSFLSEVINHTPFAKPVVISHGICLMERLLRAIGGDSPRSVLDPMADIFLALNKHYSDHLTKWLTDLLNQSGFPNDRVTQKDKELFIKSVQRERVNKKKLKETVKEFTLICRGLVGVQFGI